jgi:hypothetical protein
MCPHFKNSCKFAYGYGYPMQVQPNLSQISK